MVTVT